MAKHKIHYQRQPKHYWRKEIEPDTGVYVWCKNAGPPFFILKNGRCYGKISTQNERSQNCLAAAEGFPVRGKRGWKHVPTTWDDKGVARWRVGSWKDGTRCRKQWEMKL